MRVRACVRVHAADPLRACSEPRGVSASVRARGERPPNGPGQWGPGQRGPGRLDGVPCSWSAPHSVTQDETCARGRAGAGMRRRGACGRRDTRRR